ncbi:uncharacterized protein LOC135196421 isoform X2 [Macrobrachium nipponense]|uniref:uncharacterized protein LOC135196421 isoform X2 n=1 Tax=Macrobrachium nipponense TaxID=159736 RepID=UPI0030C7F50A
MEVSSGGGLFDSIVVFFGTVALLSVPCQGGPIDETDASLSTCNTGWELCPTTNLCVLSVCKDIDYAKVQYNHLKCQHGQVPCEAAGGACMWPCPKPTPLMNPSSPLKPSCGMGKIFCERTMTCTAEDECTPLDDYKPVCSFGSTFCLAQGGCVTGGCEDERKTERRYYCPLGKVLCVESGRCQESCRPRFDPGPRRSGRNGRRRGVGCPPGAIWCNGVGRCVPLGGCHDADSSNKIGSSRLKSAIRICPVGQEFCMEQGQCVPKSTCRRKPSTPPQPPCRPWQEFCLAQGACVIQGLCQGEDASPDTSPRQVCSYAEEFCLTSGQCVPKGKCRDDSLPGKASRCRPGQIFCLLMDKCLPEGLCGSPESSGPSEQRCHPYEEFCLTRGACVPKNTCEGDPGAQESAQIRICPPGQLFCLERDQCTPLDMCGSPEGEEGPPVSGAASCPPGKSFCLETGECSVGGVCESDASEPRNDLLPMCTEGKILCLASETCVYPGDCREAREQKSPLISCSHGEVFCPTTGSCRPAEECGTDKQPSQPVNICTDGKVFCIVYGTCVLPNMCEGSREDARPPPPPKAEVCPPDMVFCLSSSTCEKAGNCGTQPLERMGKICPRGYVYCLQRGECVSLSQGCGIQPPNFVACSPGMIFSIQKGICVPDIDNGMDLQDWLPELKCPNVTTSNRETFSHSTCLSNQHCPYGYSCCPDPETLHLQCMNADGDIALHSLSMTCYIIGKDRFDTRMTCEEPEDCRVGSVCCNGSCRSLKGLDTCPLKTLYCPQTQACIPVGSSCEKVCNPSNVLCLSTNECGPPDDCEFETSSGAPWTLPGPLLLPPSGNASGEVVDEGVALEDTFRTGEGPMEDANIRFDVQNYTTEFGTWYKGNKKKANWEEISRMTTLNTKAFLRYVPKEGAYDFGYDYLLLKERGSNITRKVVQLLAPEKPKLVVKVLQPKVMTREEQHLVFALQDLVNVTVDDDEYWRVWLKTLELPKVASEQGLLDYSHDAVVSLVNSLTMPGYDPTKKAGSKGMLIKRVPVESEGTGVRIALKSPSTLDKLKAGLAYSTDSGKTWEFMDPLHSADIPLRSPKDVESVKIQFHPVVDVWGNVSFVITSYSSTGAPKKDDGKMAQMKEYQEIMLEIQSINDAPVPKKIVDLTKVPTLSVGKPNNGAPVETYASIFYEDSDQSIIGLCILQASGGALGSWQYSVDKGATFVNITNLENDPLPLSLGVPSSYQGLIDLISLKKQQECNIKNALRDPGKLASLVSESGANDCLPNPKQKLGLGSGSAAAIDSWLTTTTTSLPDFEVFDVAKPPGGKTGGDAEVVFPADRSLKSTVREKREALKFAHQSSKDTPDSERVKRGAGQAQFSGFGTDNLNVSTVYPKVEALCLPVTSLLRFNPTNGSSWDKEMALSETRLMFTAWDMSEQPKGSKGAMKLNISLHYCIETGSCTNGSVSWSPALISAEWSDCTGNRVSSGMPKTIDACGICGGDGTSCLDCNGDLNGTAEYDCDVCIKGNTGKQSGRDCAGKCGNQNIRNKDNICVPKNNPNITYCDGKPNSGAIENKCGVCVLGTTGLPQNSGQDECGECGKENKCFGCDGKPNSGFEVDLCGKCLSVDDPSINDCQSVGKMKPLLLDAGITKSLQNKDKVSNDIQELLTLQASVAGIEEKEFSLESCLLVPKDGESINSSKITQSKDSISAVFTDLTPGDYKLSVTFVANVKANKMKKIQLAAITLTTNETVKVVDSSQMKIALPSGFSEVNNSVETKVKLSVNEGTITDEITCILFSDKGKGKKGPLGIPHELATEVTAEKEVTCTIPTSVPPGPIKLGLALTNAAVEMIRSKELNLSTVALALKSSPPAVVSAELDATGENLLVTFDQNIETKTDCQDIFKWPWKEGQKSPPPPKCDIKASNMNVKLNGRVNVINGTILEFSDGSGIIRKDGHPSTAPQAKGKVTVMQREKLDEIKFKLSGDTQSCNGSDVKVSVSNIVGASLEDVQITWNTSWSPGTTSWGQRETLRTWDSVREIKNKSVVTKTSTGETMSFPGNLVMPGKDYMVIAEVEAPGLTSEPQAVYISAVPLGQTLRVTIEGPANLMVDRSNTFKAVPSLCIEDQSLEEFDFQYLWNIEPEGADWKDREGRKVTIPKNILRGGRNYTISVKVSDMGNPPVRGEGTLEQTTVIQGVEALVSTDNLKVGSTTPIKLDASNSYDKDNNYGRLHFRWSCLTEDNSGCFVIDKSGKMDRLENAIDQSKLTNPILQLEPQTLPPGRYIFTVEVTKDKLSDSTTVNVEVAPGRLPVLVTKSSSSVIDAQEKVMIKGLITGQANLQAWWEVVDAPGFSSADISRLPAGEKTKFETESNGREYDLVIPKPETLRPFERLEAGTFYKFRLTGETEDGAFGFAEVSVRTNKIPAEGTFQVSPNKGDALITNFTFSASGWSDDAEDHPLTTFFGYKFKNTEKNKDSDVIWVYSSTSESPSATFTLAAEKPVTVIIPVVRVCDVYKACNMMESDQIILKLPDSIPASVLGNMADQFTNMLQDDAAVSGALATVKAQLATLGTMGAGNEAGALLAYAENSVQGKTVDLMNKMNSGKASLDGTKDFLSGTMDLLDDVDVSMNTLDDLLSVKRKLMSLLSGTPVIEYNDKAFESYTNLPSSSSDDTVYYPSTDEDQNAVRKGNAGTAALQKPHDAGMRRRSKRQATVTSNTDNSTFKPMTLEDVLTGLRVTEKAILSQQDQGAKTARMGELLEDLKMYLPGICLSMSYQDDPDNVLSTLVGLRVAKSQLDFNVDKRFPIVDSTGNENDFVKEDSYIRWGSVLENYTQWNCGRKGDEGEELPCYGACLATVLLKDDFLSLVKGSKPPGEIRGPVAMNSLLNTETGVEIPVDNVADNIVLILHLNDYTVPQGKMLKCYGWNGNEWDGKICTTGNIVTEEKVQRKRCLCTATGYVAVFLVVKTSDTGPDPDEVTTTQKPTTTKPTTTTTTTTTSTMIPVNMTGEVKKVKFKIYEDYNTTVGDQKEEFEASLTTQLAKEMGVREASIRNLTVSPGSILVDFDFVQDNTRLAASTPEQLYDKLSELIGSGNLVLKGLKAQELKVPSQSLDGSGTVTVKQGQTLLPIIIGSVVGGVVLIVIVLICVAVFLKNKKRMDKIQPLHTGTQQPTYSSIHFEQSLDGTAASLAKHRNNVSPASRSLSSGGTYSDEGIFIERRSTASSRARSSGGSSTDSGNGGEVPEAFRYKSPTKEQLERSGPIPEHIRKKIQNSEDGVLPGSPEQPATVKHQW